VNLVLKGSSGDILPTRIVVLPALLPRCRDGLASSAGLVDATELRTLPVLEGLLMTDEKPECPDSSEQRRMALSRWDNEGGAGPRRLQENLTSPDTRPEVPDLTNAELVQLRIRVIALENLLIALLANVSDRQLDLAREMAAYISPRPGYTPHSLTIHAASQMVDLIERAGQFRR
jgi:hypothetical protein